MPVIEKNDPCATECGVFLLRVPLPNTRQHGRGHSPTGALTSKYGDLGMSLAGSRHLEGNRRRESLTGASEIPQWLAKNWLKTNAETKLRRSIGKAIVRDWNWCRLCQAHWEEQRLYLFQQPRVGSNRRRAVADRLRVCPRAGKKTERALRELPPHYQVVSEIRYRDGAPTGASYMTHRVLFPDDIIRLKPRPRIDVSPGRNMSRARSSRQGRPPPVLSCIKRFRNVFVRN
jgi:hypothetical protein